MKSHDSDHSTVIQFLLVLCGMLSLVTTSSCTVRTGGSTLGSDDDEVRYFDDPVVKPSNLGNERQERQINGTRRGLRRGQEQPIRLRSSRCGHAQRVQVLSCQLSGFGHVVMPVPVFGNGAGSARCIRPSGRGRTLVRTARGPSKYGGLRRGQIRDSGLHLE